MRVEASTYPGLLFGSAAGGGDTKKWYMYGDNSGAFRFGNLNDAENTARYALTFQRSGIAFTTMEYGNSTDLPIHTFYVSDSAVGLRIISPTYPGILFSASGSSTNNKNWRNFLDGGGGYHLEVINDAGSAANSALAFARSGAAVVSMSYGNSNDYPSHTFTSSNTSIIGSGVSNRSGNSGVGGHKVTRIVMPDGAAHSSTASSETGYIRIKLPVATNNCAAMFSFTVSFYDFVGGAPTKSIKIYGHNPSGAWYYYGATAIVGGNEQPYKVRFGHDSTRNMIWIGETGTVWNYPQICVTDVQAGYSNTEEYKWTSGWEIDINSSLGGTALVGPVGIFNAITSDGTNSAWMQPNSTSTYGTWQISGSKGTYGGILDAYSGQAMMFDSSGNGGFYRESGIGWSIYWNEGNGCLAVDGATTSSTYGLYVNDDIYSTGDIVAYSDARVKENVYTIEDALSKVCSLRGVYYNRIDDIKKDRKVGVIAQEVLEVFPEVVTHAETTTRNDDGTETHKEEYGVDYGKLVGALIEAIKELNNKIDTQAKEIELLKGAIYG
jgi:Chaperone of endosialidase